MEWNKTKRKVRKKEVEIKIERLHWFFSFLHEMKIKKKKEKRAAAINSSN